jgi:hypothetical protein
VLRPNARRVSVSFSKAVPVPGKAGAIRVAA